MSNKIKFKSIVAQYCDVKVDDMKSDMKFREDLGFSSLDFMSFLGELEDNFEIELDEEAAMNVWTVGEAYELLDQCMEA